MELVTRPGLDCALCDFLKVVSCFIAHKDTFVPTARMITTTNGVLLKFPPKSFALLATQRKLPDLLMTLFSPAPTFFYSAFVKQGWNYQSATFAFLYEFAVWFMLCIRNVFGSNSFIIEAQFSVPSALHPI